MEDKYNWYSIGFLVTKEEVIALRTLYLEFGDEETKKTRLELPYENIEIDEGCEGYHAIDLFSILRFYQFSNKFEKPLDLEFLRYVQFSPDYGIPWQLAVFNFVEDIKPNKLKSELNFRFKKTLIWLNALADSFGESHDPRVIECLEKPDDMIYLESLEDYKKLSNNKLFNNLRTGLWYKKYGDYEKALKFLEEARLHCTAALFLFNLHNADYIEKFNDKMEPYKEIGIDIMSNPDEYHDWWVSKSKLLKMPIELQLSGEETPSFQMGEIQLNFNYPVKKLHLFRWVKFILNKVKNT
jgi:tetratricopeptide (TPR) repeat protein